MAGMRGDTMRWPQTAVVAPPTYSTSCAEGRLSVTNHFEVRSDVKSCRPGLQHRREAALDYVRSLGCSRDEVTYLGTDAVAWRGAIYRAAEVRPIPLPTT